jgi:hypothetical protein
MPTEVLDFELQLVLRPLLGTLESQVLEEVRSAASLVGLSPGASVNPHADSRGLGPWRMLGRNRQSILQRSGLSLGGGVRREASLQGTGD